MITVIQLQKIEKLNSSTQCFQVLKAAFEHRVFDKFDKISV